VDTGTEEVQVVCGAPNAKTGMMGVFAPAGAYIPGTDMTLKPGVIRGEASNGMLVSEREMGLSDEHEGIIELDGDVDIGTGLASILGLDDPVIEIGITPNRGDCLGVRGIARDLAAAGMGKLKPLKAEPVPSSFESPIAWRRDLASGYEDACPYVAGRYYRNVKNVPSPAWLQKRLKAIGLRPISALVDITNFVTFDLGRPLHVFDADKVKGDVVMRMAREGESLVALDEESYELDPEDVIIADDQGPEAIGGIMGGAASGCSEGTTNVFLEVALFDPIRVARSGRRLGIMSDARYRFERGLYPRSALWGVEVASRLILELCGGEASHTVSAGEVPDVARSIALRPERVKSLGGLDLPASRQKEILEGLGFAVTEKDGRLETRVPSWRSDVEGEACLVEEVLRIQGYDQVPETPLPRESYLPHPVLTQLQSWTSYVRTALARRGLEEAVTFSFLSSAEAEDFGGVPESLRLVNPISSDLDVMRPSLLPTLLAAAGRNADRGFADVALFEIGPAYKDDRPEGQLLVAGGLRAGSFAPRHWAGGNREPDALDAKADALAALAVCGAPVDNLQVSRDAPGYYHPGRSGVLRLGPKVLANFGELHPGLVAKRGLRGRVSAFEVFLETIPTPKSKAASSLRPALKLSPFQPVSRDFAFIVDADLEADKVLRAAKGADKQLVTSVELFDLYAGKGVEEGKKSLAITVTLQPQERTLTDAEIEAVSQKIVEKVIKVTGGSLRT
jgi:phenylalanyl-tRNA synthetase beta chain